MIRIARIAQRADGRVPAARRQIRPEPGRHVPGERLHPLVRGIAVRIQVDVGQPVAPHARAHERLRQERIRQADQRGDVLTERAVAAGMKHVRRRQLLQVVRHLRAVRVLDRMQHDVHLLQDLLVALVRDEQLAEAKDVARRRDLVRVLAAGDEDASACTRTASPARPVRSASALVISRTEMSRPRYERPALYALTSGNAAS